MKEQEIAKKKLKSIQLKIDKRNYLFVYNMQVTCGANCQQI